MEEKGIFEIKDESPAGLVPGRLIRASYEFVNFGDLLVLKNVYPYAADLAQIAERVGAWRESSLAQGADRTYFDKGTRSSVSMMLSKAQSPIFDRFELAMEFCVQGAMRLYRFVNKFAPTGDNHSPFEILRYGEGGKFDEHIDVIPGHPQWGYRRVSMVCYLDEDFEGGELVFPRQSVTYKPAAGSIVLFPSDFTHPHVSAPVTKGTKHSVVTWFS